MYSPYLRCQNAIEQGLYLSLLTVSVRKSFGFLSYLLTGRKTIRCSVLLLFCVYFLFVFSFSVHYGMQKAFSCSEANLSLARIVETMVLSYY